MSLQALDASLMVLLQETLQEFVKDEWMIALRNKNTWWPLYLFWTVVLFYQYKLDGLKIILIVALAAVCSDAINSHLLKNLFERIRPCRDAQLLDQIRVLIPCSHHFSFPSSHAANHFAVAFTYIFAGIWKRWWVDFLLILWALAIGLAQIYVGVHYPGDIAGGILVGAMIGFLFSRIILIWRK